LRHRSRDAQSGSYARGGTCATAATAAATITFARGDCDFVVSVFCTINVITIIVVVVVVDNGDAATDVYAAADVVRSHCG
jgi:hypothetical protein